MEASISKVQGASVVPTEKKGQISNSFLQKNWARLRSSFHCPKVVVASPFQPLLQHPPTALGKKVLTLCGPRCIELSYSLPGSLEESLQGTTKEVESSSYKEIVSGAQQDRKRPSYMKEKGNHVFLWTSICALRTWDTSGSLRQR